MRHVQNALASFKKEIACFLIRVFGSKGVHGEKKQRFDLLLRQGAGEVRTRQEREEGVEVGEVIVDPLMASIDYKVVLEVVAALESKSKAIELISGCGILVGRQQTLTYRRVLIPLHSVDGTSNEMENRIGF
jgi:hypothetical protein